MRKQDVAKPVDRKKCPSCKYLIRKKVNTGKNTKMDISFQILEEQSMFIKMAVNICYAHIFINLQEKLF